MKVYKKQINQARQAVAQKQEIRDMPAPEPKVITQDQEAHIKFMQGIVRDARVRQ